MGRNSLTGRSTFTRLYKQGASWSGGGAKIRYIIEAADSSKFAVSIPKSCGNAVVRNGIRRRWWEAIKLVDSDLPGGLYQIMIRETGVASTYVGAMKILSDFKLHLQA